MYYRYWIDWKDDSMYMQVSQIMHIFKILKGTVSRDFLLHLISVNHLLLNPRFFLKIRGDICKWRCTTGIRWQILPPVQLVLLIPVANLSPVSTIHRPFKAWKLLLLPEWSGPRVPGCTGRTWGSAGSPWWPLVAPSPHPKQPRTF